MRADATQPSLDQLSALWGLLGLPRAPYTDFGVWNPFGERLKLFIEVDATVLVGGEYVTKRMAGPKTHELWLPCWELFAHGMISLGAASLGSCQSYAVGMKELATLFPDRWAQHVVTDVIVRTERFGPS